MGWCYRVPICGASWGFQEHWDIVSTYYALRAGRSDHYIRELEEFIRSRYGGRVDLFNSGRSALEVALRRILRLRPGAEGGSVVVPSLICRSVLQKIWLCGLTPLFFDIGTDLCANPAEAMAAVRDDTIAILYPHLYGRVTDLAELRAFANKRALPLIEDCAAAFCLGTASEGAGSWGDYVIFSFSQGKTLVAGSGGALVDRTGNATEEPSSLPWPVADELRLSRAKALFAAFTAHPRLGYVVERLIRRKPALLGAGMHDSVHALSHVDARIVCSQITRWRSMYSRKRAIVAYYGKCLSDTSLSLPQYMDDRYVGRLFVSFPGSIIYSRTATHYCSPAVAFLRSQGVQVQLPYFPGHRLVDTHNLPIQGLAVTEDLSTRIIEVPSQPALRRSQIRYICQLLNRTAQRFVNSHYDSTRVDVQSALSIARQ